MIADRACEDTYVFDGKTIATHYFKYLRPRYGRSQLDHEGSNMTKEDTVRTTVTIEGKIVEENIGDHSAHLKKFANLADEDVMFEAAILLAKNGAHIRFVEPHGARSWHECDSNDNSEKITYSGSVKPGTSPTWYDVHVAWVLPDNGPIGGASAVGATPAAATRTLIQSLICRGFIRV